MSDLLPITLLSGFLGAGKTTLLEHILRSKDHQLRCAVIVNDMATLNIDAELIKKHQIVQKEEQVVQLQNGCICCTLRGDLLEEVARLAELKAFDYLVIESTGISEPIQVAETFASEFLETVDNLPEVESGLSPTLAKLLQNGGIGKVARLDTCVTVIDCVSFFSTFETADFLADRYDDVEANDDRTISDLMVDQIEFANVIVLNKTDMVPQGMLSRIEVIVRQLNPQAKLLHSKYSQIDLKEIMDTNLFDFEKAATNAGWLQSIHEMQKTGKKIPKPETEEYGISSYIYTARRPFHPQRLMDLVSDTLFVIEQGEPEEDEDGELDAEDNASSEDEEMGTEEHQVQERIERKRKSPVFGNILRSKGFMWLASRPSMSGEWSQAGCILTVSAGSPWFCVIPEQEWPEDELSRQSIRNDFASPETPGGISWGDRRQELVFIGAQLNPAVIDEAFNSCIVNDEEWAELQELMLREEDIDCFDDPWTPWMPHDHDQEEEMEEEER